MAGDVEALRAAVEEANRDAAARHDELMKVLYSMLSELGAIRYDG